MSSPLNVFMLDNYDSFTYILVQYLGELGAQVITRRNDEVSLTDIETLAPDCIVVSPGPCSPKEAGISVPVVTHFAGKIPILGVCLGHQSIGVAFGGTVIRARHIMHGKTSRIKTSQSGVFAGLPKEFTVNRYHSLSLEAASLPACFQVTARSDDGEIMGLRHQDFLVEGVQFHPESILTEHGHAMLRNFLNEVKALKDKSHNGKSL